jgi:hypothetical protein
MSKLAMLLALVLAVPVRASADTAARPSHRVTIATIGDFAKNGVYVHTDDRVRLREIAKLWRAFSSNATIVVEGNGLIPIDEEASIELGQRRADRVRDWLVKFGIDPSRVVAIGNSRERPGDYVDVMVEVAGPAPTDRTTELAVNLAMELVGTQ